MSSNLGLSTYRALLRSANFSFRLDNVARTAAWQKIHEQYTECRSLTGDELKEKLQLARDVSKILRSNVVPGEKVRETEDGRPVFHLKINEETELGDNDSRLPFAGKKAAKWDLKPCGSGSGSSNQASTENK